MPTNIRTREQHQELKRKFPILFRELIRQKTGIYPVNGHHACLIYQSDKIRKQNKTEIFNNIARQLELKNGQVQKHFANCYSRCMYPHHINREVRDAIKYYVWEYSNTISRDKIHLLTYVKKKIKEDTKLCLFPPSIDAYANSQKQANREGNLNIESIKYRPGNVIEPERSKYYVPYPYEQSNKQILENTLSMDLSVHSIGPSSDTFSQNNDESVENINNDMLLTSDKGLNSQQHQSEEQSPSDNVVEDQDLLADSQYDYLFNCYILDNEYDLFD